MFKIYILILFAFVISACVYLPEVVEEKDLEEDCNTLTKELTLSADNKATEFLMNMEVRNAPFSGCIDCGEEILTSILAIPVGSAIVSRSVVLIGNTIHWMEYHGKRSAGYLSRLVHNFKKGKNIEIVEE